MQNKNSHTLFDFMHHSGGNELWQDIVGYEDGGFVGFVYGGPVTNVEQILKDQGLTATPEQLALFEGMDTTGIQDLATGLQDTIGTAGVNLSQQQVSSGFGGAGAGAQALSQQRKASEKVLATGIERAKTEFKSKTLGTAADIVAGGGEFGKDRGVGGSMFGTDTSGSQGTTSMAQAPTTTPPGWPDENSYNSWVAAGSDPNSAVSYGFSGPSFLLTAST